MRVGGRARSHLLTGSEDKWIPPLIHIHGYTKLLWGTQTPQVKVAFLLTSFGSVLPSLGRQELLGSLQTPDKTLYAS